jgi:hypothetical protein
MRAAAGQRRRKTSRRKTRSSGSRSKSSSAGGRARRTRRSQAKDPKGGLTDAGRREYARTEGAHLKPGVMKPERDMTRDEMRRKGSWAARFYGRSGTLPPLVDAGGRPTRFALTAAAWGEPVPRTPAAARRIAAKGRRLLQRYRRK